MISEGDAWSEKTKQQRHSRLVDEFDKFVAMEGESLSYVYERLKTLVNVMDMNEIHLLPITINTKAKKAAKNHDPLTLVAHTNVYPSHSYASPSYSHSPQPYYVTHPSSIVDYKEDYQGEIQGDAQEDKLTTAMMLLARSITQQYSTPTNNRLRTSSNTRNQAVIQDGQIEANDQTIQRVSQTELNLGSQMFNATTATQKATMPVIVHNLKFMMQSTSRKKIAYWQLKEKMEVTSMKENDLTARIIIHGDDSLEELNAAVIMMARIQPT
ncbi:hypothetical protein Tco_0823880 [Tanacetum coccineum]|uniref:Uncharacterized protein n=1 Tax=Tanacetum coccineum TaxID=301880 RepID=A0ABQ5AK52_9ASTR